MQSEQDKAFLGSSHSLDRRHGEKKKNPQIQSGGNHLPSNYQLTTSAQKPREDEDARGASNTSPNTQIFSCCFSLNLRKSPCVSPWMCRCSIRASEEASRSSLFNNLQQRQFHRRHYGGRRRADRRAFTDPETKSNTWKDTGDMPDFHVLNVYTDMVVLIYHNTFIRSHTQNEPLAFIRNKLQRTAFFFFYRRCRKHRKKKTKQLCSLSYFNTSRFTQFRPFSVRTVCVCTLQIKQRAV